MKSIHSEAYRRLAWSGIALLTILTIGSFGYWLIGDMKNSFLDVFYMTVITISTIGYAEIIDFSNNPAGRVFTILIAVGGIGTLFYIITNFTALAVEGHLTDSFRRRRMERKAMHIKDHYIVCGIGRVGSYIINELSITKRPIVTIDIDKINIEQATKALKDVISLEGDATDNSNLVKAGISEAKGLFAVTGDDNQNLVISFSAKQLNHNIRIVARCNEIKNSERIKNAGADAVVSPTHIGGLRMASEMIRPATVSFLDTMLRDREKNLRIEEIYVPDSFEEKTISILNLQKYSSSLLLAIRREEDWIYKPSNNHVVKNGDTLVFMTTPEERYKLVRMFNDK